jgi:molecular chaperone IbpA
LRIEKDFIMSHLASYDFSPFFRSTVGFDRLTRFVEAARQSEQQASYPPYDIERTSDNTYRITMAVAGFSLEELEIIAQEQTLLVKGRPAAKSDQEAGAQNLYPGQYLYRGIARRGFERRFQLVDHIHVTGASLEHGLLHISLAREIPEALKPRRISISRHSSEQTPHTAQFDQSPLRGGEVDKRETPPQLN